MLLNKSTFDERKYGTNKIIALKSLRFALLNALPCLEIDNIVCNLKFRRKQKLLMQKEKKNRTKNNLSHIICF